MIKTYHSRISVTLVVFLALVCFCPLLLAPIEKLVKLSIMETGVFVLVMLMMNSFKYVIDGQTLKVYSLYFMHEDIDIKTIKEMRPNRNIISAPAGSMKRLAIFYGTGGMINISPRNQEDFIKEINAIIKEK